MTNLDAALDGYVPDEFVYSIPVTKYVSWDRIMEKNKETDTLFM
jgi:hypothetical protein